MAHFISIPFLSALVLLLSLRAGEAEDYCNQIGDDKFNCSLYDPTECYNDKCIPKLKLQPLKFEICKEKYCFLLKEEAPIVDIPNDKDKQANISLPFRCNQLKEKGITGGLSNLFEYGVPGEQYCVWVGKNSNCTWNMIQHLVAKNSDYWFAAGGPMLETPHRKCHHVPSSSWLDDRMVVVGDTPTPPNEKSWRIITFPFYTLAWIWFFGLLVVHIIVFVLLAYMSPWQTFKYKMATAYFLLTGDEENLLETNFSSKDQPSNPDLYKQRISRLTFLASVFRFSLKMAFLVFLIFYEAGLVNLLFFQDKSSVVKESVGSISRGKLPMYCVMEDSALANVWGSRVDTRNDKFSWREDANLSACIQRVLNESDEVRFAVSYEREAKHQINEHNRNGSKSKILQIFDLQDDIYRFNSGWLFKEPDNKEQREILRLISMHIVQNRANGSLGEWFAIDEPRNENTITLEVLAIAFAPSVFLPLFAVLLLLVFWGRRTTDWKKNLWCNQYLKHLWNRSGRNKPKDGGDEA